jgi:hypothetical protein
VLLPTHAAGIRDAFEIGKIELQCAGFDLFGDVRFAVRSEKEKGGGFRSRQIVAWPADADDQIAGCRNAFHAGWIAAGRDIGLVVVSGRYAAAALEADCHAACESADVRRRQGNTALAGKGFPKQSDMDGRQVGHSSLVREDSIARGSRRLSHSFMTIL